MKKENIIFRLLKNIYVKNVLMMIFILSMNTLFVKQLIKFQNLKSYKSLRLYF